MRLVIIRLLRLAFCSFPVARLISWGLPGVRTYYFSFTRLWTIFAWIHTSVLSPKMHFQLSEIKFREFWRLELCFLGPNKEFQLFGLQLWAFRRLELCFLYFLSPNKCFLVSRLEFWKFRRLGMWFLSPKKHFQLPELEFWASRRLKLCFWVRISIFSCPD